MKNIKYKKFTFIYLYDKSDFFMNKYRLLTVPEKYKNKNLTIL